MSELIPAAKQVLDDLLQGNERFRSGKSLHYRYDQELLPRIAKEQKPRAAVVACADSRVTPEVIFDQPLGTIFCCRVPGNVASESAKWMLEIAVLEFKVPLVMVLGHSGCLAVGQLLEGDKGGPGGALRYSVVNAVYRARAKKPEDLYSAAIDENAAQAVEDLTRDSYTLRKAVKEGTTSCVSAVYEMEPGLVRLIS